MYLYITLNYHCQLLYAEVVKKNNAYLQVWYCPTDIESNVVLDVLMLHLSQGLIAG